MATYAQIATLDNYTPTDAKLQDFLIKWYAAFETGPMEQTSDTGQFDETTITFAGMSTASATPNYQIHKLNDSLFATAPIYVKTGWYNSGGFLRYIVGVGTGTDGAGNLTGLVYPMTIMSNTTSSVDVTCAVIGSGGEGYASVFTDPAAVMSNPYYSAYTIGIFRTTGPDDQPDSRGLLLISYMTTSPSPAMGMKYVAIDFQSMTYTDYSSYGFWQFGGSSGSVNPSIRKDISRVVIPFTNFTWICPYLVGIYTNEHSYGAPFVTNPSGNPHLYQPVKSVNYSGINTNPQHAALAVIWE